MFLRTHDGQDGLSSSLRLPGQFELIRCQAGGWLLYNRGAGNSDYWLPVAPIARRVSPVGHVLEEMPVEWAGLALDASALSGRLPDVPKGWVVDAVVWELRDSRLGHELQTLSAVETGSRFLLGSHTRYQRPADLYRHLIHGHIYEDRYAWPHQRKVCSENDAHALWQILAGLELATSRELYHLLKSQVLLAVLDRQGADGGFRHGEWTEDSESHYRLHCSAMHLFMDALAEEDSPRVREALAKAADFLARTTDGLDCGRWFLHDELEQSPENLKKWPGRSLASRAFGKSLSNLLVLNTHLDSTIALDRYGAITGDTTHQHLVVEANRATEQILSSRPAEWLYRGLFAVIELSFQPTEQARRLPLWKRALKRVGWKHLIPLLPKIKQMFPRLAMPGGYIDRELSACGFAHDYHAVNLMDLARHQRRFKSPLRDRVLADGLAFVKRSGLDKRWKEMDYHRYALGFWAEALYQTYLNTGEPPYLSWLAEAVMDLEDLGMGLPPSLLGANAECIPVKQQHWPADGVASPGLRLVNLSRAPKLQVMAINPGSAPIVVPLRGSDAPDLDWVTPAGGLLAAESLTVGARSWVLGTGVL